MERGACVAGGWMGGVCLCVCAVRGGSKRARGAYGSGGGARAYGGGCVNLGGMRGEDGVRRGGLLLMGKEKKNRGEVAESFLHLGDRVRRIPVVAPPCCYSCALRHASAVHRTASWHRCSAGARERGRRQPIAGAGRGRASERASERAAVLSQPSQKKGPNGRLPLRVRAIL